MGGRFRPTDPTWANTKIANTAAWPQREGSSRHSASRTPEKRSSPVLMTVTQPKTIANRLS